MEAVTSALHVFEHHTGITPVSDILSDEQRDTFLIVDFVVLCSTISVFGIAANIVNIIIFLKQGFANTVNISFFGLAISDLCCLLTLLWMCFCFNPLIANSGVPWIARDFMYLPGAWPHVTSGRITSYITVYVTAERCLCIIAPLKVREIVTPVKTSTVIIVIYLLNIITLIPEYATSYLDWKFFPERNTTLLVLFYTGNREDVTGLVFFLSFVTGVTSFIGVIVFTVILAVKLKQSSEWREEATSKGHQRGLMSSRDKKTVKMIVVIASILIFCYTPGAVVSMTTFVVPEFDLKKGYANIGMGMWSLACVFQATNSSVNIFLYYTMSSKYRDTFDQLFSHCTRRRDIDTPNRTRLTETKNIK